MGSLYYTDMADLLRAAGLVVVENDGWKQRARGSGGFSNPPLGVQWHHTASQTSPENDINWQVNGSDDAPIGNGTIMRDGSVWLIAAGAANTAGSGGPVQMSRGWVPEDSGNSTTWAWEVANNGVGEAWPEVQINAYFTASNVANKRFGNQPTDLFTHALGAGDGWTDRKVDPATAAAVQGPWKPRSVTGSGTWSMADIQAEAARRAGTQPPPTQPPPTQPPPSGGGWVCPPFPGTGDFGCSYNTCRAWQDAMILNGYIADNNANHDGVWGNGMHNACFNMQRDFGWSDADGIGGEHSWAHLRSRDVAPCPKCGK